MYGILKDWLETARCGFSICKAKIPAVEKTKREVRFFRFEEGQIRDSLVPSFISPLRQ